MNTVPTLVCFVLDKSGSMTPLRQASIEGFNQFLRDQKAQAGECRMSLTMFDTSFDVRHVATDLRDVSELTPVDYRPGGGTALLDAVGTAVKGAEQWIVNNGRLLPWKVVVAVLTDGEENSSYQWHINQPMQPGDEWDLNGLIQWKQNEGWSFVFLGAGGSDWLERTFGAVVPQDCIVGYAHDSHAHAGSYAALSNSVTNTRTTGDFTYQK